MLLKKGSPEERSSFGRGLGVSPRYNLFPPVMDRKGVRGMVERVFHHPAGIFPGLKARNPGYYPHGGKTPAGIPVS